MDDKQEKVKEDKVNGIPSLNIINLGGGSKFIDISKKKSIKDKLNFIKKNIHLLDNYSGFIIEKHVDSKQFNENDDVYNETFSFLLNGLVIINKLRECIIHAKVAQLLNVIIGNYGIVNGNVEGSGNVSIVINANTTQQPDGSLKSTVPPHPSRLLLVHHVNYKSQSIDDAFDKCLRYFNIPSINVIIFIQIYERGLGNTYKAVAIVFERCISVIDPSTIISFGSLQLSASDITKYSNLSHQNTPITGTLFNNNNINNIPNNPIYTITIAPNSLFFQNPFPTDTPPLNIDLFLVKRSMDSEQHFSAIF